MKYSLKRFIKNLIFLTKYSFENDIKFQLLAEAEDIYLYRRLNNKNSVLKVLNVEETVDLLIRHPKSFCRYGDGEIELCIGNGIPFQQYDSKLQNMLIKILQNNNNNMYVGIDYNYFTSTKGLTETVKRFQVLNSKKYRDFLMKVCNKEREYIATGFTQSYLTYDSYDYDNYFKKIKQLFYKRELVIIAGEGILDKLEFDIFELAKNKEYIMAPRYNAFSKIDELLEIAYKYSAYQKTFICILGPTSNILVYNLTKKGYMAWDIGHLAKDYNAYMKKIEKNEKNTLKFFKPD